MGSKHLSFIVKKEQSALVMYHGTNYVSTSALKDTLKNTPMWGGLRAKDASSYAKDTIWVLQNKEPIYLINVMHPAFHDDFIARVNSAFNAIEDYTDLRICPLAAFGLPDLQTHFGKVRTGVYPDSGIGYNDQQRLDLAKIIAFAPMYGNKHRMSLLENDKRTVAIMQRLYPDVDGYIADGLWPSFHMGGLFHPEASVFKPNDKMQIIQQMKKASGGRKTKKQSGGLIIDDDFRALMKSFNPNAKDTLTENLRVVVNPLAFTDQDD